MRICGLQKLAMVDFPGKVAATVFTGGCNLRCPFCHNAPLVTRLEEAERWESMSLGEHMDYYLGQGMEKKEAMKAVAKDRGISKRDVYRELVE